MSDAANRQTIPAREQAAREVSPAAELFQKAHARMMVLHRLDEQMNQLLQQRQQLQRDLAGLQELINDEFQRVMSASRDLPAKLLSRIVEQGEVSRPIEEDATAVASPELPPSPDPVGLREPAPTRETVAPREPVAVSRKIGNGEPATNAPEPLTPVTRSSIASAWLRAGT